MKCFARSVEYVRDQKDGSFASLVELTNGKGEVIRFLLYKFLPAKKGFYPEFSFVTVFLSSQATIARNTIPFGAAFPIQKRMEYQNKGRIAWIHSVASRSTLSLNGGIPSCKIEIDCPLDFEMETSRA